MLKKEISDTVKILKDLKENTKFWFSFFCPWVSAFFATGVWNCTHMDQVIARDMIFLGVVKPLIIGIILCIVGVCFFCKKKSLKYKIQFLLCQACLSYVLFASGCTYMIYNTLWNPLTPIILVMYMAICDFAGSYFVNKEIYGEVFQKVFVSINQTTRKGP